MRRILLALLLIGAATLAEAGQGCEDKPVSAEGMQRAIGLATQVQARLDALDTQSAILARVGSDVSRYGLRYTHAGLVWRETPAQPWTLLHKLNRCGSDRSDLHLQGLANFFLDDPYEYRALLVVPDAALERDLREQARRDQGRSVHEPHYSLIAYPFGLEYQNSNQWLLEFVTMAASPALVQGRKAAIAELRREGYEPDRIAVGPFERLGAGLFRANTAFLDHPISERLAGRYSVVTVESLVRHLQARGRVREVVEIGLAETAAR